MKDQPMRTSMHLFQKPVNLDLLVSRLAQYVRHYWPECVFIDETPDTDLPADVFDDQRIPLPAYFTVAFNKQISDQIYPLIVSGKIPPQSRLLTFRCEYTSESRLTAYLTVTHHRHDNYLADGLWRLAGLLPLNQRAFDSMMKWLLERGSAA